MKTLATVVVCLGVAYAVLLLALLATRPKGNLLQEALRLLPDLLRLVRRLAADQGVPRGARVRLWLLLGYLASPIDLIPDFIPVLGYADDAVMVSLVLRSVIRKAGTQRIRDHWPGTDDGLRALGKVIGLELGQLTNEART